MTYPGQDGNPNPWQPQQPPQQPGTWPQQPPTGGWPQQPQPQYPQPQYQPPQYQHPQRGQEPMWPDQRPPMGGYQPTQQQPFPGQPPFGTAQYPAQYPLPNPPQPKRRRGTLIGALVAVLVLAGGGVGAWFAFGSSSGQGEATPQAAATKLMSDISSGDVLGVANDLPPGEASVLRDATNDTVNQLKRLNIVKPDVSSSQAANVDVKTSGITFDTAAAKTINDHLTVNELTGGTITVSSTMWANEATSGFLHQAFPDGVPNETQTIDIAQVVHQLGHPIGIATVKVDGTWYPSFYYTLVNAGLEAAHLSWPSSSTPDVGADSSDDAVRAFVQAALNGDLNGVIERLDPNEMAALHDAGPALVQAAGAPEPSGVEITSLSFQDRPVTDGVDAVVRSVTLSMNGDTITVSQNNGCYSMQDSQSGQNQTFCASDLSKQLRNGLGDNNEFNLFPPSVVKLLDDMITGMMNKGIGIVTTQVNGQWYVSPTRTLTQIVVDVYGSITPNDFAAVLQQVGHH